MKNPFRIKCAKFEVKATGFKHEFEVTVATGQKYTTYRTDYLWYNSYHHSISLNKFNANDMMEVGLKWGFEVDAVDPKEGIVVTPVSVQEKTIQAVWMKKTAYKYYWLWFKPEKPFVADNIKNPIINAFYDWEWDMRRIMQM